MSISVDGLSDAIMQELLEYLEGEEEIINAGIDEISAELVISLKNDPVIPKRTGKYKKSFYYKKDKKGIGYKKNIVANRLYQLTHLLENPHVIHHGTSMTRAHPHWATAQKKLDELMEGLVNKL